MVASLNGHTEAVKVLLDYGVKIKFQNYTGSFALMVASLNGHTEVVKLLLVNEYGAQVDNDHNFSPWLARHYKCALTSHGSS